MHCSKSSRVTRVVSPFWSPLSTTISKVDRAVRASPLAKLATASSTPSSRRMSWPPKPRGSERARRSSSSRSCWDRAWRTNTRHRDRRAAFTSKLGFSVVAPMSTMLPFST